MTTVSLTMQLCGSCSSQLQCWWNTERVDFFLQKLLHYLSVLLYKGFIMKSYQHLIDSLNTCLKA